MKPLTKWRTDALIALRRQLGGITTEETDALLSEVSAEVSARVDEALSLAQRAEHSVAKRWTALDDEDRLFVIVQLKRMARGPYLIYTCHDDSMGEYVGSISHRPYSNDWEEQFKAVTSWEPQGPLVPGEQLEVNWVRLVEGEWEPADYPHDPKGVWALYRRDAQGLARYLCDLPAEALP